jgi:hypothetical protein
MARSPSSATGKRTFTGMTNVSPVANAANAATAATVRPLRNGDLRKGFEKGPRQL